MTAKFVVRGGNRLSGTVTIGGAKNSALPIVTAAALAAEGESILENVPDNSDIQHLCEILRALGCRVERVAETTLRIQARELEHHVAPYHLARRLRGSTYVMGLLLRAWARARWPAPAAARSGPVRWTST